jgi:hypothetical protein
MSPVPSYTHLYKSKSPNSTRLRQTAAEASVLSHVCSKKSRFRKKNKEMKASELSNNTRWELNGGEKMIWDGKEMIYFEGGKHNKIEPGAYTVMPVVPTMSAMKGSHGGILAGCCCLVPPQDRKGVLSKDSYQALQTLESISGKSSGTRGNARAILGTQKYASVGTKPNRSRPGLSSGLEKLSNHPDAYTEVSRILRALEHVSAKWISHMDLKFVENSKRIAGYQGFSYSGQKGESLIWPALSGGRNVYLPLHTDQDYFLSAVVIYSEHRTGNSILQYFCFPTRGKCIPLRNGDVLLFNPQIPHCISSPTSTKPDVFSISAYLKTLVVSGNSNGKASSLELEVGNRL